MHQITELNTRAINVSILVIKHVVKNVSLFHIKHEAKECVESIKFINTRWNDVSKKQKT